jgi:hypothetical protein
LKKNKNQQGLNTPLFFKKTHKIQLTREVRLLSLTGFDENSIVGKSGSKKPQNPNF